SRYIGAGGETEFYNVFRKFIPDAGGINLKKTWAKDDVFSIPDKTWLIEKTLNSSDIEVVAFIQNSVTKELYQAVSVIKPNIITGIENAGKAKGNGFALFPNPAETRLTIKFGEMLNSETEIRIYDFRGTIVRTYKVGSGEKEFIIDNLGLMDGIYLVRVTSGGFNYGFKKLIIANN
ncbi:MAG: T9SS type A sorting domain-containing protein, partial [Bacteroidetes bacterium]